MISNIGDDVTTNEYNELGQITQLTTSDISSQIQQFTYQYDKLGNITKETRIEGSQTNNRTYSYDEANQLIEFVDNNYVETYTYDNVGNMLTKSVNDILTEYTYNEGNQLINEITNAEQISYNYNSNGDLTSKSTGEQYSYDIQGNLTAITGNGIDKEYTYNGNGNRLSESTDGETVYYVNDVNRRYEEVLQTYDEDGNTINTYTYGLQRIDSKGEINETYLYDGRGSVVGAVDNSNEFVSYSYTAYGELMPNSPTPNVFGYNAEATDYSTGLQYLRARYYDTDVQRFVQEDDYKGDFTSPASMNRYAYVGNNPTMRVDPSGYKDNLFKKIGNAISNAFKSSKEYISNKVTSSKAYQTITNSKPYKAINNFIDNPEDTLKQAAESAIGKVLDWIDKTPQEEKIETIDEQIQSGNAIIPDAIHYPSDDGYYDHEICMVYENLNYTVIATGSQEEIDQLIKTEFFWDINHMALSDMATLYEANKLNGMIPVTEIEIYTQTVETEISDKDALSGLIKAMGDKKHDDSVKEATVAALISGLANPAVGIGVGVASLFTQTNNDEEAEAIDTYYDSLGGEYATLNVLLDVDIDMVGEDYKGGGTHQWYGAIEVTKTEDDDDTYLSEPIMTENNPLCGEAMVNLSEEQYNRAVENLVEGD